MDPEKTDALNFVCFFPLSRFINGKVECIFRDVDTDKGSDVSHKAYCFVLKRLLNSAARLFLMLIHRRWNHSKARRCVALF
jgi:hypothetical protein